MRIAFLLAVVVSLSACSFNESREYRVAGGARRDTAKVRHIVQQIAAKVGLSDRTLETHIDHHHPIANFADPHTSIEAYTRDRDIEVSLSRSDCRRLSHFVALIVCSPPHCRKPLAEDSPFFHTLMLSGLLWSTDNT